MLPRGEAPEEKAPVRQVTAASKTSEPAVCVTMEEVVGRQNLQRALKRVPGAAGYRSAVNQFSKSVVREIRTLRSVGAGGGQPPLATRWRRL